MTLLLDERPVVLQPSLVRRLGLLEAAIVQQLHYWSQRATRTHDAHAWVYKTYSDWGNEIGVSAKAARGAMDRLRRDGVVVAIQNPTDLRDRTLWWRIDHALLAGGAPSDPSGGQTDPSGAPAAPEGSSNAHASGGCTETTSESTAEKRASALNAAGQPPIDDAFPDDLPEPLHGTAVAVGKILKRTALTRGQKKPVTRAAVGHAVLSFEDRPHVQVAREVEFWLLHGKGARKECKDIVARYRHFLDGADPAAGPPLPVGVTPLHGGRRGRTTMADYQALKGTLG
jgi:hypothetical protein